MPNPKEQECFDIVKSALKSQTNICYGMTFEEERKLQSIWNLAKPNPNTSLFPDFIFENGFIEHFQVTSSKQNRHGAKMEQESCSILRDFESKTEQMMNSMDIEPCFNGDTVMVNEWHSMHSHDFYIQSLERSLSAHLQSMAQYSILVEKKIFMISYHDNAMRISRKLPDIKHGLLYGDYFETSQREPYKLSRDKQALELIHQMTNNCNLKYIVFINDDKMMEQKPIVEIFRVDNIPECLKIIRDDYSCCCCMIGSAHLGVGISIPNICHEGSEENDESGNLDSAALP